MCFLGKQLLRGQDKREVLPSFSPPPQISAPRPSAGPREFARFVLGGKRMANGSQEFSTSEPPSAKLHAPTEEFKGAERGFHAAQLWPRKVEVPPGQAPPDQIPKSPVPRGTEPQTVALRSAGPTNPRAAAARITTSGAAKGKHDSELNHGLGVWGFYPAGVTLVPLRLIFHFTWRLSQWLAIAVFALLVLWGFEVPWIADGYSSLIKALGKSAPNFYSENRAWFEQETGILVAPPVIAVGTIIVLLLMAGVFCREYKVRSKVLGRGFHVTVNLPQQGKPKMTWAVSFKEFSLPDEKGPHDLTHAPNFRNALPPILANHRAAGGYIDIQKNDEGYTIRSRRSITTDLFLIVGWFLLPFIFGGINAEISKQFQEINFAAAFVGAEMSALDSDVLILLLDILIIAITVFGLESLFYRRSLAHSLFWTIRFLDEARSTASVVWQESISWLCGNRSQPLSLENTQELGQFLDHIWDLRKNRKHRLELIRNSSGD